VNNNTTVAPGRSGKPYLATVGGFVRSSPPASTHRSAPSDAYDNALAKSTIGLYKTELNKNLGPWRDCDQVEIATLEYVDWYNHRRPHTGAAELPPALFETLYDPNSPRPQPAGPQPN
jgi:transposase InsO family protein